MADFQPINIEQHQHINVKPIIDWQHIAKLHQIEITVVEALQAASSFPLFFIKNSHTGATSISAITSFVVDSNVLVKEDGEHQIAYVPQAISLRPFTLGIDPENEKSIVPYLDIESHLIDDEGEALFEGDKATPFFQQVNQQLEQLYHGQVATGKYIQDLQALNVIQNIELELSLANGQTSTLKGLSHLSEERLMQLSDEQQKALHDKGYYGPIYAMLSSLTQINRLIQGHAKLGEHVNNVNIKVVK